jgi:phenylalanine-4-hydroxylase
MEIRPLDIGAMATVDYDITSYQPVLFAAESLGQLEDVVGGFFETADDDTPARLEIALTN